MKIGISTRLRPFSHRPGIRCLIPGTCYLVEVFPALIRFYDLNGEAPQLIKEVIRKVEGPLRHFSVFQDLERRCITVFLDDAFYHILPNLEISYQKRLTGDLGTFKENFSLGSHKKQLWEAIEAREDFREIVPLWYRLGCLTRPSHPLKSRVGMFSLLDECQEAIDKGNPEQILSKFRKLFRAGFSDMLVPRLIDEDHQGIHLPNPGQPHSTPLHLLREGARLIRSLFFKASENHLFFLPHLPPEFFSGRFVHLECSPFGQFSFEWSKKFIKKVIIHATGDGIIQPHFQSSIQSYRIRTSLAEKGKRTLKGEELEIKSNTVYLLDRFEK